jgi:hypothetical protein
LPTPFNSAHIKAKQHTSTNLDDNDATSDFSDIQDAADFPRLMPASVRSKSTFPINGQKYPNMDFIERPTPSTAFLEDELNTPSLNRLHIHLWMAGRPMPPRPLTYQLAVSRNIVVVETMDLHLVWEPGRIFLKPLPRYLLNSAFWAEDLACEIGPKSPIPLPDTHGHHPRSPSSNQLPSPTHPHQAGPQQTRSNLEFAQDQKRSLYKSAYGFLLSYAALVQYESDYHIAQAHHLLPPDLLWESWRQISYSILEDSPHQNTRVNKRYHYGELCLRRLNKISRWQSLCRFDLTGVMRGYRFGFATYGQQLNAYLAPILAATAYILLILTAMQVGLATDNAREMPAFHWASWVFTIFAILAPLGLVLVSLVIVFVFVIFNYLSTRSFSRVRMAFLSTLGIKDQGVSTSG